MTPTLKEALEKLRTRTIYEDSIISPALAAAIRDILAADSPVHPEEITYRGERYIRAAAIFNCALYRPVPVEPKVWEWVQERPGDGIAASGPKDFMEVYSANNTRFRVRVEEIIE